MIGLLNFIFFIILFVFSGVLIFILIIYSKVRDFLFGTQKKEQTSSAPDDDFTPEYKPRKPLIPDDEGEYVDFEEVK